MTPFRFILNLLVGQINYLKFLMKQTVITCLPPIGKPITNYEAIVEMFTGSKQLYKQANTKYTHITLAVGVAIMEFHV